MVYPKSYQLHDIEGTDDQLLKMCKADDLQSLGVKEGLSCVLFPAVMGLMAQEDTRLSPSLTPRLGTDHISDPFSFTLVAVGL